MQVHEDTYDRPEISTQKLLGQSTHLAKIFGIFVKSSHWVSIVRAFTHSC